jgi:hypothetical protein
VDQHGTDHQIRLGQALLDIQRRRETDVGAPAEDEMELDAAVIDGDPRAHADRDGRCVHPHDPAADDHDPRRRDAGKPA